MAGPDLVVKVAANISALQADMTRVAASVKTIETAATSAGTNASAAFGHMQSAAIELLGAFGVAFSVGAVVGFGREIMAAADELVRLHDKTDISIQGLQQMQVAGDDAGVSLESMTSAVNMLQKRIGGDDASALAALQDLGISLDDFKQMDGAQMFIAVSDAVRQIHDPLTVAHDLAGLFGKAWADQVPVLKRGFDDVKDSAVGMSEDTAKAIDAVGDSIRRASRSFQGDAANVFAYLFLGWSKNARDAAEKTEAADKAAGKLAGTATDLAAGALKEEADAAKRVADAAKAAADADAKWADVMGQLTVAGDGWKATLATIDGTVAEGIKCYLAAGVSQATLATAYGLTAVQVKAVASSLDAENARTKEATALTNAAAAAKTHWAEVMGRLTAAGVGWQTTLDTIDGSVVEGIKFYLAAGVAQADLAEAYGLTDAQIQAVSISMRQNTSDTNDNTAATDANADANRQRNDVTEKAVVLAKAISFATAEVTFQNLKQSIEAQMTSFEGSGAAGVMQKVGNVSDLSVTNERGGGVHRISVDAAASAGYSFNEIIAALRGSPLGPHPAGPRIPGFAGGIEDAPGGWAMVGERGPEPMYVPPHASIYPSGSSVGGGVTIVNHNYITQPLGTPTQIAALIDAATMKSMRDRGVRF